MTILIFSCNLSGSEDSYDWELPIEITTIHQALKYVHGFTYQENNDEIFTPEELYNAGYGDCADFSIMLQFIFETKLNLTADLVAGKYNSESVNHSWVESEGIIYETTSNHYNLDYYKPVYKFEYPESVCLVEFYGELLRLNRYRY